MRYIGYYGCSEADRLVCVKTKTPSLKPHYKCAWDVDCPACGGTHRVKVMWRSATDWEIRKRPELVLPDEKQTV